jgi:hypothetical protein
VTEQRVVKVYNVVENSVTVLVEGAIVTRYGPPVSLAAISFNLVSTGNNYTQADNTVRLVVATESVSSAPLPTISYTTIAIAQSV